ncbi:MAG: zinc-finger domain-containing protein [Alphaproteobacteria bacterium]|nr:zinc-finger domain-containing protein [Alphaproteobacteria bacterium]
MQPPGSTKPSSTRAASAAVETIEVTSAKVACDGGALGHPRVFLDLSVHGRIDCPYCGRRFVLARGAAAASASH